jgi:hypothetical protein
MTCHNALYTPQWLDSLHVSKEKANRTGQFDHECPASLSRFSTFSVYSGGDNCNQQLRAGIRCYIWSFLFGLRLIQYIGVLDCISWFSKELTPTQLSSREYIEIHTELWEWVSMSLFIRFTNWNQLYLQAPLSNLVTLTTYASPCCCVPHRQG